MHVKEADPKIMDKLTQMKRIVKKEPSSTAIQFAGARTRP